MAEKPAEILLFDFLDETVQAARPGDVLFDAEVHDTTYQKITKPFGIRVSDASGEMSPTSDGVREYNVSTVIVCFAKVEGKDKKARVEALTKAWQIQKAVYALLFTNPSLGDRVCDIMPGDGARDYDILNGNPYAVAIIPVTINNGTGA